MHIIVPAYNVKPDQATRFEAQIAAVMLRHRAEELAMTKTNRGPRLTATPPSNSKAAPRPGPTTQAHRRPSEGPLRRPSGGPPEAYLPLRPSPHREGAHGPLAALPAGHSNTAEALIIRAQHVQYKPGGTSPTDELIVKVLIVAAKNAAGRPGAAGGLSTIQVAEKLDISRQAANAALKRLQAKKLITIVPVHDLDPETRRGYGVALKALWTVVRA
jgi:hypothetical protein